VRALAEAAAVARLEALDLSFNRLGANGVRALLGSHHLGRLAHLNLSHINPNQSNNPGDASARALARHALLGRLEAIDLSLNRIGDAGGRALAGYDRPCRLTTLDLIYNHLGAASMQALRQRFSDDVCLFNR
jgi:Leucine Rich repeat